MFCQETVWSAQVLSLTSSKGRALTLWAQPRYHSPVPDASALLLGEEFLKVYR